MPSNLERAMVAETTMHDYSGNKEGQHSSDELYDVPESAIIDLIADLCHLLHLDEKTAGCMPVEKVRDTLRIAFLHFEAETIGERN